MGSEVQSVGNNRAHEPKSDIDMIVPLVNIFMKRPLCLIP